eukprot:snap_masked-scaffold_6-processed-gene-8.28-mRNA-1 protein AED:1.00 eAED:1.00 QI:0/0/0/0/1/1/2/0/89
MSIDLKVRQVLNDDREWYVTIIGNIYKEHIVPKNEPKKAHQYNISQHRINSFYDFHKGNLANFGCVRTYKGPFDETKDKEIGTFRVCVL